MTFERSGERGGRSRSFVDRNLSCAARGWNCSQSRSNQNNRENNGIDPTFDRPKNVTFADLEENLFRQEFANYEGTLLWKMDEFFGQQVSFYSPLFYTFRHGYKMCARMYRNGDGMGKRTHISLFFAVQEDTSMRPALAFQAESELRDVRSRQCGTHY